MTNITKSKPETQGLCPLDLLDAELKGRTIMGDAERTAVALWVAHTYVFTKFNETPRLLTYSVKPGCGKSKMLNLLAAQSSGGMKLESSTTFANIRDFRKDGNTTLALDQLDGIGKTNTDDLKLLNLFCSSTEVNAKTGHKEEVTEDGKKGWKNTYVDIGYPVALGKIGTLPNEALMSRCISVRMYPETEEERDAQMPARIKPMPNLRLAFAEWLKELKPVYIKAPKEVQGDYRGRTEDIWQPLLSVARHAGPPWEERALATMVELYESEPATQSRDVQLLHRVYEVTKHNKGDEISGNLLDNLTGEGFPKDKARGWALKRVGVPGRRSNGVHYDIEAIRSQARRFGVAA